MNEVAISVRSRIGPTVVARSTSQSRRVRMRRFRARDPGIFSDGGSI
jgi:hypothetical protein